jgi:hypothetical protein
MKSWSGCAGSIAAAVRRTVSASRIGSPDATRTANRWKIRSDWRTAEYRIGWSSSNSRKCFTLSTTPMIVWTLRSPRATNANSERRDSACTSSRPTVHAADSTRCRHSHHEMTAPVASTSGAHAPRPSAPSAPGSARAGRPEPSLAPLPGARRAISHSASQGGTGPAVIRPPPRGTPLPGAVAVAVRYLVGVRPKTQWRSPI